MLIYKSFFRKKTTHIYFIVYTLIIFVICLLLSAKNILEIKDKELHYGSYLLIQTNNIDRVNDNRNVSKVYEALEVKVDNDYYSLVLINNEEYKIKGNNAIISPIYMNEYKENDKIIITIDSHQIELNVYSYDSKKGYNDVIFVSNELVQQYKSNKYLITLKDWNKKQDIISFLNDNDIETIYVRESMENNSIQTFITIINISMIVLIILFCIILVITSLNIVEDENKKNSIYSKIGYGKQKLKIYNFTKIILLIVLSSAVSITLTMILNIIYKIIVR